MTKKESQKLIKSAKKTLRENIKLTLVKELKEVVAQFGHGAQVAEKEISKSSKHLAKKLSKKIKIDGAALSATVTENKPKELPAAAAVKAPKAKEPKKAAK